MKNTILVIICIALISISCTSENEIDLVEPIDTGITVTYNNDVAPIINSNCLPCHNNPPINGAPNPLSTFEEVRTYTKDNLIDRISRPAGAPGAMPLGGPRLSQSDIDLIILWSNQGFLEDN